MEKEYADIEQEDIKAYAITLFGASVGKEIMRILLTEVGEGESLLLVINKKEEAKTSHRYMFEDPKKIVDRESVSDDFMKVSVTYGVLKGESDEE
jgi:hypothetical protein